MSASQQQPHQAAQGSGGGGVSESGAAASGSSIADKTVLVPYVLEPPRWRAPLIANKTPSLYPDFFPGATALYPQSAAQSGVHVPGVSRDSSLAGNGVAGTHFIPVAGVTASKEDELSETVAKLGFVNKAVVQTENFSAHALIHNKLHNGPSIHALGKIVQKVLERQRADNDLLPNPGPWTYKPPSKVVYNASRLETWYSELANPSVPLSKLAKTIPSAPSSSTQGITSTGTGTYGGSSNAGASPAGSSASKLSGNAIDRNLDMLITRQVPRDRALWFLQAVGQTEIGQLSRSKNLQMHPILTYSGDFTVALVECLRRQIGEALLPLTQSTGSGRLLPGMSVKGRPRNILAEEHNKDRWMSKWNYTLDLLGACLQESMLDRQRLCTLLLQNLQPQNRIQMLWWLSVILQTSMEDMLDTAWMSKTLIVALYEWLSSLGSPLGDEDASHAACEEIGQGMLRHLWLTDSEMFLIPHLWTTETQRLRLKNYLAFVEMSDKEKDDFNGLEDRVDVLLCRKIPRMNRINAAQAANYSPGPPSRAQRTSKRWHIDAARVVRLLDNWDETQPISALTESLFKVETKSSEEPKNGTDEHGHFPFTEIQLRQRREVVRLLLMWATTTARQCRHRPYLVVSVLCHYTGLPISEPERGPSRSDIDANRFEELQMDIMEWIDSQESYLSKTSQDASSPHWTTRAATLHMCQMLLKQGVLEIGGLVQKVIARGYTKAQEAEQNSIYSTILREYNGHSEAHALRWQMTRVSLSCSRTSDGDAWTSIREDCAKQIQPLIKRVKTGPSGCRTIDRFQDLYPLRDSIMSISTMRRAVFVDEWLLPTLQDALMQNISRDLDVSTFSSIWWLLNEVDAAQAQVKVICIILRDFPAKEEIVLTIVAAYGTQHRTFAACGGRRVYAANLLIACLNFPGQLNRAPATQILSELVKLGFQGHLDREQLHTLRRLSRTWHKPTPPLPLLANMMSPPDVDKRDEDMLSDLLTCLSNFTQRYGQSQQSQELLNSTLACIVSACGMPSNYFGAILPAMLHFLNHLGEAENRQINALCCLASTVASITPPAERKQEDIRSSLLTLVVADLRQHFSGTHAQFLQQLVLDNVASLNYLFTSVCKPMIADLACQLWSQEAATSLVKMLSSMLVDEASGSTNTWLLVWARNDLLSQPTAFQTIVSVAEQILRAYEDAQSRERAYSETLRSLYRRLLALPEVQEILLKHVSAAGVSGIVPGKPGSIAHDAHAGPAVRQVLLDALGQAVRSWSASPSASPQQPSQALEGPDPMTGVFSSDTFAPLISPISRCYLKLHLDRPDGVIKSTSGGSFIEQPSQRRHIASQFFQHVLASEAEEQQELLKVFGPNIGTELYAVAMEAILAELQSSEAATARSVDSAPSAHLPRLSTLVDVLDQLNATCRSTLPAFAERLSFEPTRLFGAVASACGACTGANIPFLSIPMHLLARLVCFAMTHLQPVAEQLDAAEACGAALWQRCRLTLEVDGNLGMTQDTLAWLLQDIGLARRRRLLEAGQDTLLPTRHVKRTLLDMKAVSLGPHPPFAYMTCQDAYFLALQRTWSGTSSHSNTTSESNPGSNNQAIDVLKYSCQTELVERHIQPAYRSLASSGWSAFDSEIPWQQSTTFQRDFRRATITPADIPQLIHSQSTRSRVLSQSDIIRSQSKSQGAQVSNDAPKQVSKEKPVEQASTSKKRKSVPDVIIIDENSPKKKSKTTIHTSNSGQASKGQKKKQQ